MFPEVWTQSSVRWNLALEFWPFESYCCSLRAAPPFLCTVGVVPDVWSSWETDNYHVMGWFLAVFQSADCLLICAHSNTIIWWGKWLTTITSHDRFNFPTSATWDAPIAGRLRSGWIASHLRRLRHVVNLLPCGSREKASWTTHGSFLIRRQRSHPGVVLPLVISNSANH